MRKPWSPNCLWFSTYIFWNPDFLVFEAYLLCISADFFPPFSLPKIVIKMMWQFLMWNTGGVHRQRLQRAEIYVLCISLTLKSFCSRAVTWSLLFEMLSIPGKLSALEQSRISPLTESFFWKIPITECTKGEDLGQETFSASPPKPWKGAALSPFQSSSFSFEHSLIGMSFVAVLWCKEKPFRGTTVSRLPGETSGDECSVFQDTIASLFFIQPEQRETCYLIQTFIPAS